jgi:hypothetical protein
MDKEKLFRREKNGQSVNLTSEICTIKMAHLTFSHMDKEKLFRREKNGQSVNLTAEIYTIQNFGMGGCRSLLLLTP